MTRQRPQSRYPDNMKLSASERERRRQDSGPAPYTRGLTEAPELGDMMARMIRSLVRRATSGDLEALEQLAALERVASSSLTEAMRGAHDGEAGYSYTELGQALGITRQAARQRATR